MAHRVAQTEQEREQRLSKTLCYLLRHGGIKEGLPVYKGGYFSQDDIMCLPQMKRYSSRDLERSVTESISNKDGKTKRFEYLFINGIPYIRATYGHSPAVLAEENQISFPVEESYHIIPRALPKKDPNSFVPDLFSLCLKNIVQNIKLYSDGFSGIADSFLLECLMNELKRQNKLNTANLKLFLIPELESLSLGKESFISDATLKKIAQLCPNLITFRLEDCVSLTDTMLEFLLKRCKKLANLQFVECKYVSDVGLASIAKFLKGTLHSVTIVGAPSITDDGIDKLVASCLNLQSLTIVSCEKTTSELLKLPRIRKHLKLVTWKPTPVFKVQTPVEPMKEEDK